MNLFMTILLMLTLMKMFTNIMMKKKSLKNFMNNLECGYNNLNNYKINYSMNFIYIMIIFILFDIELMMMIPLLMNFKLNIKHILNVNLMILFMMLTTLMELKNNKIIWLM